MNKDNEELRKYILEAEGISRSGLNIMAFIGVFIFGWLLAWAFSKLGKGGIGWAYIIFVIILTAIARSSGDPLSGILAIGLYIIAWVHANILLSHYESIAKERLAEIDRRGALDMDVMLEKGLLLIKVFQKKESALNVFNDALRLPGGDPTLLNLAGVIMFANQRYREATWFYNRALGNPINEVQRKQINKNLEFANKKAG